MYQEAAGSSSLGRVVVNNPNISMVAFLDLTIVVSSSCQTAVVVVVVVVTGLENALYKIDNLHFCIFQMEHNFDPERS